MFKKKLNKRKWRTFLRRLITIVVLFVLGVVIGVIIWDFKTFSKSKILNPVENFPLFKSSSETSKIEDLCREYSISCESVKISSDSSIIVKIKDNGIVILSPNKNLQDEVASLQLTISDLTIEGKSFKLLDFRYDRPVITF